MASAPKPAAERKTDRLELRVTPSVREVIQRATAITGLSAGDLAYQAAQRIVEQHEMLFLAGADARAFAEALVNPPEPSGALMAAFSRHTQLLG